MCQILRIGSFEQRAGGPEEAVATEWLVPMVRANNDVGFLDLREYNCP